MKLLRRIRISLITCLIAVVAVVHLASAFVTDNTHEAGEKLHRTRVSAIESYSEHHGEFRSVWTAAREKRQSMKEKRETKRAERAREVSTAS